VPGRHAAPARRAAWEARYLRTLPIADAAAALAVGGLAFQLRFGQTASAHGRAYLVVSLLLAPLMITALAMTRAYESRFLFVGNDEYQRVIRAGIFLTAGTAMTSYAFEVPVARSYVLLALPGVTFATVAMRFVLRKRLYHARERGACLRRVIVVGHELAVIHLARQLRRERYHGLKVVGACLPPRHDGDVGLPVYGTFDDVATAVDAAGADTVVVLSCPELDGPTLRRLAWRLERDEIDLIVASALIDVAGPGPRSGRSTACRCCTSSTRGWRAGRGSSRRSSTGWARSCSWRCWRRCCSRSWPASASTRPARYSSVRYAPGATAGSS
jgi:FlaA1/EpsC-like NDP-sugar epimerase